MQVLCPYCGKEAELVGGGVIYPHRKDLYAKKFFLCEPCEAYVGTHVHTKKPLGRLANAELRKAKIDAHAVFDLLWNGKAMSRLSAYQWLAEQLDIPVKVCHIGMFDVEMCKKTVEVCRELLKKGV